MEKPVLIYDVEQKPARSQWFLLSLQHVLAMFGATVLVPLLTGLPVSTTLISAGIGTLTYIVLTRGKSPVFLGSSFAYIVPTQLAISLGVSSGSKNYGAVMIGLLVVGLIYLIISTIIRFTGTGWINKVLPPIVIGPVIMVIGLSLASTAVNMVMTNNGVSAELTNANLRFLAVSGITLLTAILVANYTRGITKLIPVMIGIVVGYISAICFGLVDFTPVIEASKNSYLGLFTKNPDFAFTRSNLFTFLKNDPKLFWNIVMLYAPVALVTISEHIGDHLVLSSIIGRNLLEKPGLSKTLAGDGLATAFAGIIGGPANTTYGENTGVIGITKVASVWVIGTAAVIAFCLGFIAPFTVLIRTIPGCVMGGVSMMLFGIIASSGVRVLINNRMDFAKERNLMIAAVILVSGIGGLVINIGPISLSSMAVAAILGIILHQILPNKQSGYGRQNEIENRESATKIS